MTAARQFGVEELHRALGGKITRGANGMQVLCPGPGHSDNDRSLAVLPAANGDGFIVFSHADDDVNACKDHVRQKLGLPPFHPGNGKDHAAQPQRKVIAKKYDYTDEGGNLLFQVVRLEPKDFRQRRPDGENGWIWNLEGVRRVPYRLPELLEAIGSERPVFVAEGEKDVDALWQLGIPATCNSQGAGKWRDEYSKHFRGATVYVLPDNDAPGSAHAQQVAQSLTQVGAEVRVVDRRECRRLVTRAIGSRPAVVPNTSMRSRTRRRSGLHQTDRIHQQPIRRRQSILPRPLHSSGMRRQYRRAS